MIHFRWLAIGLAPLALLSSSCATSPSGNDTGRGPGSQPPAWAQQPARTVDGGYIVFVGKGEDMNIERAHFEATGMAIQDLVNECSLAPKGTRSEDRFEQKLGNRYQAWVKVSIQYEDCEAAKRAVDPEDIRKLANAQLTEELERYQDLIDEPEPETLAAGDPQGVNPAAGNTSYASSGGYGGGGTVVRVVAVNDYNSFFWARQQVAYTKQVVILSPPAAYPPGAPQTVAFVHQVTPMQSQVQRYEVQNPEVRSWNQAYSGSPVRQQMMRQQNAARMRSMGNGRAQQRRGGNGGGRRRRRWKEGR